MTCFVGLITVVSVGYVRIFRRGKTLTCFSVGHSSDLFAGLIAGDVAFSLSGGTSARADGDRRSHEPFWRNHPH